jgi:SAM-dependent methyltransferase
MRFLVQFRQVAQMTGLDATAAMVELGRQRTEAAGLADRISFRLADVCGTGLAAGAADFVWGEDAWCYVTSKPDLIREAVRLARPAGVIAFTDWIEGKNLDTHEAERFLRFMKFPSIQDLAGYQALLEEHGCQVLRAEDTGRFGPYVDLYLDMLNMQLTYDALKIIGFDQELMGQMAGEMQFMQELAHAGKIAQGLLIARKKG